MRSLLVIFTLFIAFKIAAQPLNNEWIDYSKTYYKFKVGATGLYRIPQTALVAISLQNTPAEQFQLWRNGKQVPLYTSVANGTMGNSDYIEFWGERNDGLADKYLYRNTAFQLSDRISLQTDTAAFFLTVNTVVSQNLRFAVANNNIPATPPAPEASFTYTLRYDFKDFVNRGYAVNVGENVYSASYDAGEFLSSPEILLGNAYTVNLSNFYQISGSTASVTAAFAGNSYKSRNARLSLNNTILLDTTLNGFSAGIARNNNVDLSLLTPSNNAFTTSIVTSDAFDRIVCAFIELRYQRQFNFGGANNFSFTLPASAQAKYLEISNFSAGNATPILYDFINLKRYTANTSTNGILKFFIPALASATSFILVSEDGSNITNINTLQQRNFTNYSLAANQGNYLIISHKALGLNAGQPVDLYRQYRTSAEGGSYNASVFDIDDLVDQFAFGIKKHPLSIKNFIRSFAVKPNFVFIIGKGTTYEDYRKNESSPYAEQLNLVPTWGWPASDILLVSPGMDPIPSAGVGRIAAITQQEVSEYLNKVKEYESQATNSPQTIAGKSWMKQVIHVAGADDANLSNDLINYLKGYENIVTKPAFGGTVANFNKTTTGPVATAADAQLNSLFASGIGLITYFGHGAASTLDYANLNDPALFNNAGKYPVFLVNGCSVGNFFDFDPSRFTVINSLSEKYVFAHEKGAIAFIGNSHFGLTTNLDNYSTGFYKSFGANGYGKSVAKNMQDAISALQAFGSFSNNYFNRTHAEETVLNGDPAVQIYTSAKPDFVVEEAQVAISPSILSVADNAFNIKAYLYNIGKAVGDSVSILVKQQYPDGTFTNLIAKKIASVKYMDSVVLNVPIIASRDKGTNIITVSIDNDNQYDEISENNNAISKSFVVFEDDIKPVYPYNFAIVNKPTVTLQASTANPLSNLHQYVMEIDTTELFNSPLKTTKTTSSSGGVIAFEPSINFTDSTVYYWRVAQVPTNGGAYRYNTASFIYLANSASVGFNQSHVYQQLKSSSERITLDSNTRTWKFNNHASSFLITHSVLSQAHNEPSDFQITLNTLRVTQSACVGYSIIFNVFDPINLRPYFNQKTPSTVGSGRYGGFMGTGNPCGYLGTENNFEIDIRQTSGRNQLRDFMDWIPSGAIVIARLIYGDGTPFADVWKADQQQQGSNTLYDRLKNVGFADIDSFNRPRVWAFAYQKNVPSFAPKSQFTEGVFDQINLKIGVLSPDTLGYITSPTFGPAASWKQLRWRGKPMETAVGDVVSINVIGITANGAETSLYLLNNNQQDVDISAIDANQYPYIKLKMINQDSINVTPYQLGYWRLLYDPVPEGAIAPNMVFKFTSDTLQAGQTLQIAAAFKNVSTTNFKDSVGVKVQIVDKSNNTSTLFSGKLKQLLAGDTTVLNTTIATENFLGNNTLFINFNPNNQQPEQYFFNNFLYKNFYVKGDVQKPVLDVTFNGLHILNNDIVSSQPAVRINLKDDSKFLVLNDTSLLNVQLLFPDGTLKRYNFNTDTLRFTPATLSSGSNNAVVEFNPYLPTDGTYTLYVTGKDKSGNAAGTQTYKVSFLVYNKSMISNVFNYPNPFTTSTAFAFTLTGTQIPQNIKIQILTITGKIVKEITQNELGPLHIGNNITDYKWDGTDMFGAKLGNGVYLYRVVTTLNGNKLDKFTPTASDGSAIDTDKYFKAGYGKMYLMR